MKSTNVYLEAIKNIPLEIQKETSFSFAVSDKIHTLLINNRMTQKELAKKMGKTEAEVSVWLSGQHNFTLRTLAKISVVLGEDLIQISK
ncbi:MAG: helix-turn-helix transcriptional regulator [Prevotella sp.]|nr:helix-turn-helix transcriptional regulator [Prevotella sp.]MDE7456451.1 helix-turn-helix transcriptional regulator [Prevotella sp.]